MGQRIIIMSACSQAVIKPASKLHCARLRPGIPAWFLLAFVAGASPRAHAADVLPSPFRGVKVPGGALAGDADGASLELNPGQLGVLTGASSALLVDAWGHDVRRPGRGGALMLGTPLFLGAGLGAGFHWLRPTLPGIPSDYQKLQLGFGVRLGRGAGFGMSWEHIFSTGLAKTNSFTFGLGVRLASMLAAGVTVRDVARARLPAGTVPREWDFEAILRPLGTDRLEIAGGVRLLQASDTTALPRARVSARLARGLLIFGEMDWPHYRAPELQASGGVLTPPADYAAMVGLTIEEERLGVTVAGVGNWRAGDQNSADFGPGGSFMLRAFPARHAPLWAGSYVARVRVSELEADRNFVALVVRLRQLGDDPAVAGVLLDIEDPELGLGRIEELRALVADMRKRKPVLARLTQPDTRATYLASACDRVFIDPALGLTFDGFAQTVTFYKTALDRLGVEVDLVRIAEYKGAMEPFVMNGQSSPVAANRNAILDDVFGRLLASVADGRSARGLDQAKVRGLVDRAVFSPEEARQAGLVDRVADEDELKALVMQALAPLRDADSTPRDVGRWRPARVAVVLVDGTLVDGEGSDFPFPSNEFAWSDRIIAALDEAAEDPSVRAVVLRVNSPGGSVLASDRIARVLVRLRKLGKPVLASMGDVAASGGYYVAAPASEIFASPSTLTGSIGIFGFKVNVQGLLGRLGIASETYKRGAHADLLSASHGWNDEERALMSGRMEQMYRRFLDTVAEGRQSRGVTVARADELGRGRVWTGSQAVGVGLVDRMGGISVAIDEAARRGGVTLGPGGLPELVVLPRPVPSLLGALSRIPGGRVALRLLAPLVVQGGNGILARMPYDIETK
ncbi:MAG TPA: signal peptide peptidase SppA [Polyangia bacterium]|jgi:signal peptide peptidase SppA, 36K type|nr:signal peptide peptidase SppA [Polyangia bacterium]